MDSSQVFTRPAPPDQTPEPALPLTLRDLRADQTPPPSDVQPLAHTLPPPHTETPPTAATQREMLAHLQARLTIEVNTILHINDDASVTAAPRTCDEHDWDTPRTPHMRDEFAAAYRRYLEMHRKDGTINGTPDHPLSPTSAEAVEQAMDNIVGVARTIRQVGPEKMSAGVAYNLLRRIGSGKRPLKSHGEYHAYDYTPAAGEPESAFSVVSRASHALTVDNLSRQAKTSTDSILPTTQEVRSLVEFNPGNHAGNSFTTAALNMVFLLEDISALQTQIENADRATRGNPPGRG